MNDLKDYHHQHHQHHQLDNDKIEYSTHQSVDDDVHHSTNTHHTISEAAASITTIANTNHMLTTNELQSISSSSLLSSSISSSFHPVHGITKKMNGSQLSPLDTSSLLTSTVPLPPPPLSASMHLGTPPSSILQSLSSTSSPSNSATVTSASTLSPHGIGSSIAPSSDSQRLSEQQHWYHHHHHHPHHAHHHHHHHHNHLHPHQIEEQNFLMFGSSANPNKLHDCADGDYFNSRYNVKGVRSERTSSFFDIPAATHPYCYRFPSNPDLLKKELEEERVYQSHASTLHLNQHYHHKIEYPDSTTNLNQHQNLSQTIARSSPSDLQSFSTYNNSVYAAALRPADSTIVSSTEPEIGFASLYPTCSPTLNSSLNQRRGSLQLWQFLVSLLDEPATSSGCIAWTGKGMEFKLIEPEEVARRWGIQKNRPAMNYDKLSRSLRYYYEKGIMQKVAGERYVYKFVCAPEALFSMAYGHHETNYATNGGISSSSNSNQNGGGSSLSGNSHTKLNSMTTILDNESHHQHSDEMCAGGKLNSLYYNNSLHNKF